MGRRSLSGYLAQSVVFGSLPAAWGLGLGAHLSSWSIMVIAVATWLVTLAGAVVLERHGMRGPAEVLLRRLSYRRRRPADTGAPRTGSSSTVQAPVTSAAHGSGRISWKPDAEAAILQMLGPRAPPARPGRSTLRRPTEGGVRCPRSRSTTSATTPRPGSASCCTPRACATASG
nr:DUF418 domain-containing protein [uncultured Brachybacterium sp.]